jgi:hypothetical protein
MSFNFENIKNLQKNEDAIFNLFLKYKITSDNSFDFVKNFLSENNLLAGSTGVSATMIYSKQQVVQLVEKLKEGNEYVRKMEKSITKDYLKQLLKDVKSKDDMINIITVFQNSEEKEHIYITPLGVVKLIDDDYKEFHNKDLKALFYQIMLLCAYEKNNHETVE